MSRRWSRRSADSVGRKAHTDRFRLAAAAATLTCALPAAAAGEAPTYETVVTAPQDRERGQRDLAADSSAVTRERTARAGESLPQLLGELPGVFVTRTGGLGAPASVSLRGSTPNQVQVYVDGVPLNAATGGGVDLDQLPVGFVERVEVYRGATPMAFGASGIGGVVSLTTAPPDSTRAGARLEAGSWDTRGVAAEAGVAAGRVRVGGGLHVVHTDGDFPFLQDQGTAFDPSDDRTARRQNNAVDQTDGFGTARLALSGGRALSASVLGFGRDQGVPGRALIPTRRTHLDTRRWLGRLAYTGANDLGPGGRLNVEARALTLLQRFSDPEHEISGVPTATRDRTTSLGGQVSASRAFGGVVRSTLMLDTTHEWYEPYDAAKADPAGAPGSRTSATAGLETSFWVQRTDTQIIPSLRLESARDVVSRRNAFTDVPEATAPTLHLLPVIRLALVQSAGDHVTLRANGGRYARLPSLTERYGNTGFIVPNPDLVPESGWNADAGAAFRAGTARVRATADVTAFAALSSQLIVFEAVGQQAVEARNVGRARVLGVDAALSAEAGRHGRLTGQVTFSDARDTSDVPAYRGRPLPLRPRLRGYVRPELRAVALGAGFTGSVYADFDYTGGNTMFPNGGVEQPSRALWGAGTSFAHEDSGVRLTVSAQNLTDARVWDVVGYPLPGRSFFVSFGFRTPPSRNQEIVP